MRRNSRDTIRAVSLFIAFSLSPAVLQQGLFSPWAWGAPLLFAALGFAVLSAMLLGAPSLAGKCAAARRGGNKAGEAGQDRDGEEAGSPEQEETALGPDKELADALGELEPANYMDLVRALQEMGRNADALEVLAHVAEAEAGGRGEEVAQALRRMRQKLSPGSSGSA